MVRLTVVFGLVIVAAVCALAVWRLGAPASGESAPVVTAEPSQGGAPVASAERRPTRTVMFPFRGPLAADKQPSDHVGIYDIVALVTVTQVHEPRWNTPGGTSSGVSAPEDAGAQFIYTPVDVKVDSYIKGSGPETLRISKIGGTIDGLTFEVSDESYEFTAGMSAVVFLNPPGINVDGWTLGNAYIIEGNTAYSTTDQREISVDALLPQLEQAAAESSQ